MARKKAVIQKEWDAAAKNLDTAITKAVPVTEANLKDVNAKLAAWEKLLNEAVAKIGKWEGEQDSERNDFKAKVEHQRDGKAKTYKRVADEMKLGLAGTDELYQQLDGATYDIKKIEDRIANAKNAVKAGNATVLVNELGIASSLLKKNIRPYSTKTDLEHCAKAISTNRKFDVKYLNLDDAKIQAHFKKLSAAYKDFPNEMAPLEEHIDELLEKLASKEPETSSSDPVYKQHLKDALKLWKSVADETKASMPKVQAAFNQITRVEGFVANIGPQQADGLAKSALNVYMTLAREFGIMEQNIQDKIRTADSEYNKRVEAWKITTEDRVKTLKPLADRAFGLNVKASDLKSSGATRIKDVLEKLVTKFNSAEAKTALTQIH